MGATEAQAAGVEAAAQEAETKSTATNGTPPEETKETKSTKATPQEEADKEILEDLNKDAQDQDESDEADDTDETEDTETDDESDEETEESDPEAEEAERAKGAEARKQALQTEIRELVSKRNELRAEVEQENAKAYRTETAEELVDQGLSQEEAENEALRQEMQMREFNIHVADLNANLNIEALQVMQDFPVFDPDSNQFDEGLRDRVRNLYEQAAQPVVDKRTGLVIKSNIAPYEFYKAFAETHQASVDKVEKAGTDAQVKAQKAAEKNLAAAETPSSTAPRKKAEDPFLKGLLSKES